LNLADAVMALLFVADAPASPLGLALALSSEVEAVVEALDELEKRLNASGPLQLVRLAGGFQLATRPEFAPVVATYLRPQGTRLSRSQMEVLAVVAYRQPITMAEIEQVRGVGCDHAVKALVERRLVQDVGRKQSPGRPILYGTTAQFLHQFNMHDLGELPKISEELE